MRREACATRTEQAALDHVDHLPVIEIGPTDIGRAIKARRAPPQQIVRIGVH